jgi:hypothetical protein
MRTPHHGSLAIHPAPPGVPLDQGRQTVLPVEQELSSGAVTAKQCVPLQSLSLVQGCAQNSFMLLSRMQQCAVPQMTVMPAQQS